MPLLSLAAAGLTVAFSISSSVFFLGQLAAVAFTAWVTNKRMLTGDGRWELGRVNM